MRVLLALVAGWLVLMGSFVLVMHAKKLRDAGGLSLFWKVNILPWAVVGLVLDSAFNCVAGTIMYAELPREMLFTSRCKRHAGSEGWRGNVARWWAKQLNQIDPGHV